MAESKTLKSPILSISIALKPHWQLHLSVLLTLIITVFAPYLNSWFPALAQYPMGNLLRDLLFCAFTIYGLAVGIIGGISSKTSNLLLILFISYLTLNQVALIISNGSILYSVLASRMSLLQPLLVVSLLFLTSKRLFDARRLYHSFIVLASLLIILGIGDTLSQGELLTSLGYLEDKAVKQSGLLVTKMYVYTRASAGVADALNYGYLMAFIGVYFMYLYLSRPDNNKINLLVSVLCLAAVFLTLTRGAMICYFVGCGVQLLSKPKKIIIGLLIVLTLFLLFRNSDAAKIILARFGLASDVTKVTQVVENSSNYSSNVREEQAIEAVGVMFNSPLGVGLGTQGMGNDLSQQIVTDNYFLQVLLEIGFAGGMTTFALYFVVFTVLLVNAKNRYDKFAVIAFIIMFIICGLLSAAFAHPTVFLLFFIIVIALSSTQPVIQNKTSCV